MERSEDECYYTACSDADADERGGGGSSSAETHADHEATTLENTFRIDLNARTAVPLSAQSLRLVAKRWKKARGKAALWQRDAHYSDDGSESSCSELGWQPDASSSDDDEALLRRTLPSRRQAGQLSVVFEQRGEYDSAGRSPQGPDDAAAAAARVQALQRGRRHRRQLAEEAAAAAKVQAAHRGRAQRKEMPGQRLTFEEATAPRPYLVVACSYPGRSFELRGVR